MFQKLLPCLNIILQFTNKVKLLTAGGGDNLKLML